MTNPQQPELARSRKQPHQDQDAVAAVVEAGTDDEDKGRTGAVPPDNAPGHHPEHDQDKPDAGPFAAGLGVPPASDD